METRAAMHVWAEAPVQATCVTYTGEEQRCRSAGNNGHSPTLVCQIGRCAPSSAVVPACFRCVTWATAHRECQSAQCSSRRCQRCCTQGQTTTMVRAAPIPDWPDVVHRPLLSSTRVSGVSDGQRDIRSTTIRTARAHAASGPAHKACEALGSMLRGGSLVVRCGTRYWAHAAMACAVP
jgi:hypothetical protein